MTLYLLAPKHDSTRGDPWRYDEDCNHGFVVRACDEAEARRLAQSERADEGRRHQGVDGGEPVQAWIDPDFSTCTPISSRGKSAIILADYRAG